MANPPAYQYYPADFDEDTAAWDVDEVGIYQRLLNYSWINGWKPGEGLPDDKRRLAKIARCDQKQFNRCWKLVSTKFAQKEHELSFITTQGGESITLINRRLEEEREIQREYRESQSESGKRGVAAKKKKGIFPFNKSSNPSSTASSDPSNDPANRNQTLHLHKKEREERDIEPICFLLVDKSQYELGIAKIKEYLKTYPNVRVMQELRQCAQWDIDNPEKRKTKKGILRHINSWLQTAQEDNDKQGYVASAQIPNELPKDTRTPEEQKADMDKFKKFAGDTAKKLKTMD